MTTQPTLQTLDTTQLRKGDIVHTHGMRVLLVSDADVYPNGKHGETARFDGRVLNLAEVKEQGLVPASFLRTEKWEGGWVVDRDDVWVIQGNELATWSVERNT